jgi:tetratricopeptide (TPR) repeat protein
VFHHLAEQGKLLDQQNPCDLALQTGALQVPESLRLVIGRRLAKLREETKRVLTTAAVIGRSFDLRLLEALESGRPDAALDATEEAERAHLVEPDRGGRDVRYRFVHELVRQTLVESLALPRRRRLHGRVADAIEGLCGAKVRSHASAIAHHLYRAGAAADLDKTVAYLLMAAREACAGAAHEEALANVDTAFALVEAERHPLTAELHGARAVALRSLSRFAEAVESYERAIASFVEAGHIAGATEASFHLAYLHLWNADHASALAVVDRAFRITGTESWPLRRRLLFLRALSFGIKGDMEASLNALSEAKQVEAVPSESPGEGFASMCEAR